MQTLESFSADTLARGYAAPVAVERDARYALGEHSHPFDACALIVRGSIHLRVAGTETVYTAGQVFELPREIPHTEWAGAAGVVYWAARRV